MVSLKVLGAFVGALFIACAPMPVHAAPLSRAGTRAAIQKDALDLELTERGVAAQASSSTSQ